MRGIILDMKTLTKCEVCNYGYFIEEGHNCGLKEKIARIKHRRAEPNKKHLQKIEKVCPICHTSFLPTGYQVYCGEECKYYACGRKVDKKQD